MANTPTKVNVGYLVAGPHAADRLVERVHLEALAESLRHGQEEPLVVRLVKVPDDDVGRLQVVVGERRRQALALAGLTMVDAFIDSSLSDEKAHQLSAEHNAGTANALERAEGVLRAIHARLATRYQWRAVAAPYGTPLLAVKELLTLSLRKDQSAIDEACRRLGYSTERFNRIADEALDLYYGPIIPDEGEGLGERKKRRRGTFAANDALLTTYPEPLRAKLRLGELRPSHAQAINQVTDPGLRDELLDRAIKDGLSVAALRALQIEANLNGRLARDPGIEQLEIVVAAAQRALTKRPALSPRSLTKATRLATDLQELLSR